MNNRIVKAISILFFSFLFFLPVHAQLGKITIDLEKDKPEKFKTKTLKSEKTGEKKFTLPRRFIQNTVSHYNYFFNANNKINEVIERARLSNKDDYAKLLPFYGYSLTNTAAQNSELDSVIYKATAGILLHDLRSDWVDNLYLLIGKAYYLRQDFDSASQTFQFINYNLYPRKKKVDDQLIVGSNDNGATKALSISSKEDRNIIDKAWSRPPSRNDALVWQIRTLIEMKEYGDAAGVINTLQNDPAFPGRLDPALEEMSAYWFYNQQMYDSAIVHLDNSLPNTIDMADRARREFLLAQLNEINKNLDTASDYYDKAIRHTTDPLMDIYANLNKAKMLKSKDSVEIDKSIAVLLRMAKKDKYDLYRDIIYFSAADLAIQKPDTAAAVFYFRKSIFYNELNVSYKNRAFLNLAEISYNKRDYKNAFAYYDSLQTGDTTLGDLTQIRDRRNALEKIVENLTIIEREDSLQLIAAMSPADRDAFIKKLSKKLKKDRGIKDTDADYANSAADFFDTKNAAPDLFNVIDTKGDWYFYNASLKSKGYAEFKRVWGKRSNVDNWRRLSSGDGLTKIANPSIKNLNGTSGDPLGNGDPDQVANIDANGNPLPGNESQLPATPYQNDVSAEGLLYNVPLTKELMDVSKNKVSKSLFQLGKNYQNLLEDYPAAIDAYQQSLQRFPDSLYAGELYMNVSYCYRKTGDVQKADYYKNLVLNNFGKSKFAQYIIHPDALNPTKKDTAATRRYQDIYNLFIEGNFEEATKQKQKADSVYGANYWNPQLLYIESMYYIHQRQDSVATGILNQIINQYPGSALKEKAATMIDVLQRRSSIEGYLSNLTIERAKEDSQIVVYDSAMISKGVFPAIKNEKVKTKEQLVTAEKAVLNPEKKLLPPVSNGTFTFDPLTPQYVVMLLNKVDPVYGNEAKNAFVRYSREKFRLLNLEITKDTLDTERTLLVFTQFENADAAISFMDKIKKDAPSEVSWLPADKYSFYIISSTNLDLLKGNKNLANYLELLNKKYPGKF
ncbi:MAG TPA: tetratricopeptide repeat protein [Chitinophagaceae bacterium]|nr:tetratricopeptide repeat protein [Chitinophagaceae bacterium]